MSAIFVKIPPPMRSTLAPSDSPMAKPMKHGPASSLGMNSRMQIMHASSTQTSSRPMLMPACNGMNSVFSELPFSEANAAREFAVVLIRIPNHATP